MAVFSVILEGVLTTVEEVNFRTEIAIAAEVDLSRVTLAPTVVYEVELSNAESFTLDNQNTFRQAIADESAVTLSDVTIVPKVALEVRLTTSDFTLEDQNTF